MTFKSKRRKFFADKRVQGTLAKRLVTYWCISWLVVLSLVVGVASFFGVLVDGVSIWSLVQKMLWYLWLPLLISLIVLPVLVRDCVRLSNRFAGPVLRFRRAMKQLANGDTVQPIHLRRGDFWQELADDFNRVLARFQPTDSSAQAQASNKAL